MAFQLDPDFRRDAPRQGPYCVRCQRPIRDPQTGAVKVTVDWDTWSVTEGGDELMGTDCWNTIRKKSQ